MSAGLSPLARGTHKQDALEREHGRFIPAGAGNTITSDLVLPESPVYPRWRGEHDEYGVHNLIKYGLSPLARGTLPECFGYHRN